MERARRNQRALRLALACVCLTIAVVGLLAAIAMLGTARSLATPARAVAPYDAVRSERVSYTPRPSMPPTCAPVHPAKGCVYVASLLQYAIVDYPLQLPVNASDTVTLTLSVHDGSLSLGPSRGTLAAAPILLPADISQYRDIAVVAAAMEAPDASTTKNPIIWQMTQPSRQSLLATYGSTRAYRNVSFTWKVTALSAGSDVTSIAIHVVEEGLDGSESLGPQELTDSPIPIIAVSTPSVGGLIGVVVLTLGSLGAAVTLILDTFGRLHDALQLVGALRVTKNAHAKAREVLKRYRARRAASSASYGSSAGRGRRARPDSHGLRAWLHTRLHPQVSPAPTHHRATRSAPRQRKPPHPQ